MTRRNHDLVDHIVSSQRRAVELDAFPSSGSTLRVASPSVSDESPIREMSADEVAVRDAIREYSTWFSNYRIEELTTPSPNSRADTEEQHASGRVRELLVDARNLAAMRLVQARSCLDGATHCFDLPDPVGSVQSLSRVVLEACAYSHWLSDTSIDGPRRASRAAADVLHGKNERRKIVFGNPTALASEDASVAEYRADLDAAGIVAERRPGSTIAAGLMFNSGDLGDGRAAGEVMYRALSANPLSSSHVLLSKIGYFDSNFVEPARTALFASMYAFDVFADRMGWGGRPAWRSWAGRTWASVTTTNRPPFAADAGS